MTLDQYYHFSQIFTESANQYNYFGLAAQLRNHIAALKSARNNAQQAPQLQNYKAQIEQYRVALLPVLKNVQDNIINKVGIHEFSRLQYDKLIGDEVYNKIANVTTYINLNNYQEIDDIDAILIETQKISSFFSATNSLSEIEITTSQNRDNELEIIFDGDVLFTDLNSLSSVSKVWYFIINAFSRLVGETDTNSEIISIKRGSLIITIGASSTIIIAVTTAADKIMDLVIKSLKIKQQQVEIEKLKTESSIKILELLEKDAKININKETKRISEELMQEFHTDTGNRTINETKGFVLKSVKELLKFETQGGRINPKLLNATQTAQEAQDSLKSKNTLAIQFINSIGALEAGKKILLIEENTAEGVDDILTDNVTLNESKSDSKEKDTPLLTDEDKGISENGVNEPENNPSE